MRFTKKDGKIYWLEKTPDGIYQYKKYSPTRNLQQSALYWALLSYAEEITGNKTKVIHKYLKEEFLPKAKRKRCECFWKVMYEKEELTTTTMSEAEFSKYFWECERELAEYWVILPPRWWKEWENFLDTYS